jgi:hypothetical protein
MRARVSKVFSNSESSRAEILGIHLKIHTKSKKNSEADELAKVVANNLPYQKEPPTKNYKHQQQRQPQKHSNKSHSLSPKTRGSWSLIR